MLEDMKKVCSASERYQAMRTYIHARDPPCVPFIGAYLDMIYGIDVTMKTYDEAGFVNFSKMARLAHQVGLEGLGYANVCPWQLHRALGL